MHVVALIGSLRRDSYNRMAYNAVRELLPPGVTIEEAVIRDLPLYDDDVRVRDGFPPAAARLRAQIAAADAVLFVSPEYNYSVPGVLKNAIDWVSRAPDQPLKGKPVAIMGATTGMIGTARMQYHLRQILVFVEALPTGRPEVMITFAAQKFDEHGRLTDEATRNVIRLHLETLVAWTRRLGGG
jgi:chromate reductase, NAD(P)H dehydrogenase (quinone)